MPAFISPDPGAKFRLGCESMGTVGTTWIGFGGATGFGSLARDRDD